VGVDSFTCTRETISRKRNLCSGECAWLGGIQLEDLVMLLGWQGEEFAWKRAAQQGIRKSQTVGQALCPCRGGHGVSLARVGFVHHFRPLSAEELRFILEQKRHELGLAMDLTVFDDVEAMSTILRITGGNFRLLQRLFAQSARIMQIDHLTRLTDDVIEAPRESLVIGVT
jgi:hypothetical protein